MEGTRDRSSWEGLVEEIKSKFVAVAFQAHYVARRTDAEGAFYGAFTGEGNGADNGFYAVTPGGRLLAAGRYLNVVLEAGMKGWIERPEAERRPGAALKDFGKVDPSQELGPPPGGLILKCHWRSLTRGVDGELRVPGNYVGKGPNGGIHGEVRLSSQPLTEHLWLTEVEWKSLIPATPKVGTTFPVPGAVKRRLLRWYLREPTIAYWPASAESADAGLLELTVENATAQTVRLRLKGAADLDPKYVLEGMLVYDPRRKAFSRFNLVAVSPARPEGVAFELASGERPVDRIAPVFLGGNWRADLEEVRQKLDVYFER